MGRRRVFKTQSDDVGRRVDVVCRKLLPGISLGQIHKAIRKGDIRPDREKTTPEERLSEGNAVEIYEPLILKSNKLPARKPTSSKRPRRLEKLALSSLIVRQTPHLIIFNKPRGLLVHGPASLDAMVKSKMSSNSLSFQPGPLHRLDQNTSGLVVFSKSLQGAQVFSQLLKSGQLEKTYLAILRGTLRTPTECTAPLLKDEKVGIVKVDPSGLAAVTRFVPIHTQNNLSLVLCFPKTGRTHQIRVHAREIEHPLAGDGKYDGGELEGGFVLHAWRLRYPEQAWGALGQSPLLAELPTQSLKSILQNLQLNAEHFKALLAKWANR